VRQGQGVLLVPGSTRTFLLGRHGEERDLSAGAVLRAQLVHRLGGRWTCYRVWSGDRAFLSVMPAMRWFACVPQALPDRQRLVLAGSDRGESLPEAEEPDEENTVPGGCELAFDSILPSQVKDIMLIGAPRTRSPCSLTTWDDEEVLAAPESDDCECEEVISPESFRDSPLEACCSDGPFLWDQGTESSG